GHCTGLARTGHGPDIANGPGMIRRCLLSLLALVGCATSGADDPDGDPDLDGKADGTSATMKGAVDWTAPSRITFDSRDGHAINLAFMTFTLSGDADVTFETQHASSSDLDTVLYVYAPKGDAWGSYVARDDDGGYRALSKLTAHFGEGQ